MCSIPVCTFVQIVFSAQVLCRKYNWTVSRWELNFKSCISFVVEGKEKKKGGGGRGVVLVFRVSPFPHTYTYFLIITLLPRTAEAKLFMMSKPAPSAPKIITGQPILLVKSVDGLPRKSSTIIFALDTSTSNKWSDKEMTFYVV